jgi:nucleoside-diphosphate-sugar epimerase
MANILVTGGGGFIGGHLVGRLLESGHNVRSVDVKPLDEWHQVHSEADNKIQDLQLRQECETAASGIDEVYNLAADMGGMGFIENNKALCMLNVLINTHMLEAVRSNGGQRFFFASSACVYAHRKQTSADITALKEEDAYPAEPEDGYGWEKLFDERLCRHYLEDFGIQTRVGRYHNVYGPHGTWTGGREKAPAAVCRKIAEAKLSGNHEIAVWGDGHQTRSFTYIDDCLDGTIRLTASEVSEPVNIGSSEMVTINQLVALVAGIAGIDVTTVHDLSAPQGVRGRNSDNTLVRELLDWEPSVSLHDGLEKTYAWVYDQVVSRR